MMTIRQYFLLKLIEECAEVAHVAAKQMQFGGYGTHPRKVEEGTNRSHLRNEINDLLAVIDILVERDEISNITSRDLEAAKDAKRKKINKYLSQSEKLGLVDRGVGIDEKDCWGV
jgi:NTP pyrophosphatase (non-canonical NTP hydrolase)